jgi:hypothetical protein
MQQDADVRTLMNRGNYPQPEDEIGMPYLRSIPGYDEFDLANARQDSMEYGGDLSNFRRIEQGQQFRRPDDWEPFTKESALDFLMQIQRGEARKNPMSDYDIRSRYQDVNEQGLRY